MESRKTASGCRGGDRIEGLNKKEKRLEDMNNRVVIFVARLV